MCTCMYTHVWVRVNIYIHISISLSLYIYIYISAVRNSWQNSLRILACALAGRQSWCSGLLLLRTVSLGPRHYKLICPSLALLINSFNSSYEHYKLYTVSFHNFKSQNVKLSVSNPKSKSVAYMSVLSQISNCQSLSRKNRHDILKTDRTLRGAN